MDQTTQTQQKTKFPVYVITGAGLLTAVAVVLQFVQIPMPFLIPSFIKFDASDLPALVGSFAYGPVVGIIIEFLKNLIHYLTASSSGFVGPLSNFLLGAVFAGVAGLFYIRKKNKKNAIIGAFAGAVAMALLSVPINHFIVYPFYYQFMKEEVVLAQYQAILPSMKSVLQCLFVFNMPFTLAKGVACALITMIIYKPISPLLKWDFKNKKNERP
ncbi:MAG: ECF transporter S component [Lachnospiraceae bacterium]|nr:ECF transporter S component [Lachnospiraceae bacterium]